jgi:hypothetical protein
LARILRSGFAGAGDALVDAARSVVPGAKEARRLYGTIHFRRGDEVLPGQPEWAHAWFQQPGRGLFGRRNPIGFYEPRAFQSGTWGRTRFFPQGMDAATPEEYRRANAELRAAAGGNTDVWFAVGEFKEGMFSSQPLAVGEPCVGTGLALTSMLAPANSTWSRILQPIGRTKVRILHLCHNHI